MTPEIRRQTKRTDGPMRPGRPSSTGTLERTVMLAFERPSRGFIVTRPRRTSTSRNHLPCGKVWRTGVPAPRRDGRLPTLTLDCEHSGVGEDQRHDTTYRPWHLGDGSRRAVSHFDHRELAGM